MRVLTNLAQALFQPLALVKEYRNKPNPWPATVIVAFACVFNAIASPLAMMLANNGIYPATVSICKCVLWFFMSAASFLAACLLFKGLAALFGKRIGFGQIYATWGITFVPTILCIAAVEASETWFSVFVGNTGLGIVLSTFLILLLAWKTIYYFMEIHAVLGLKGGQTVWAVIITAAVFWGIMMFGIQAGLKVPML